jgi:hypothetical protein
MYKLRLKRDIAVAGAVFLTTLLVSLPNQADESRKQQLTSSTGEQCPGSNFYPCEGVKRKKRDYFCSKKEKLSPKKIKNRCRKKARKS